MVCCFTRLKDMLNTSSFVTCRFLLCVACKDSGAENEPVGLISEGSCVGQNGKS